jgi:hypothetical protein
MYAGLMGHMLAAQFQNVLFVRQSQTEGFLADCIAPESANGPRYMMLLAQRAYADAVGEIGPVGRRYIRCRV